MQVRQYEALAKTWTPEIRDPVVGSFDAHNAWRDYEILFEGMETDRMKALDYGCGPGRCLVNYADRFLQLDGADISRTVLRKAAQWKTLHGIGSGRLYHVNGCRLNGIPSKNYDFVYSVICLQHVCVHDIRISIIKDIFRVLKAKGVFSFQMGMGGKVGHPWASWYDNDYTVSDTNGAYDVSIIDIKDVSRDLRKIGFRTVTTSSTRPTGPGDFHKNWLFIKAWK